MGIGKIDISKSSRKLILLCWFTIILCNVLKFLGYKEFEMPIFQYDINVWVRRLINCAFYIANTICFSILLAKRKINKNELLIISTIGLVLYISTFKISTSWISFVLEIASYFVIGKILTKLNLFELLIEIFIISGIVIIFQALSLLYRNLDNTIQNINFIADKILQIDYYTLMLLVIIHELKG